MAIPSSTPADPTQSLTMAGSYARGLRMGVPIRAVVEGRSEAGWLLRVAGQLISARSSVPLTKGQQLTLVAARRGNAVVLRVAGESVAWRDVGLIRESLGVPDNQLSAAVIRAAMRSGIGLKADRIKAVYRLVERLRRSGKSSGELARSASLLSSKGITLDGDFVELIAGTADPGTGERDNRGTRERHRGQPEASDLAGAVKRAFTGAAEATHPLQLFNHLVGGGDHDHWLVVPLSVTFGTQQVTGSIRICVPRGRALGVSGEDQIRFATVVLSSTEGEWRFSLSPIAGHQDAEATSDFAAGSAERQLDLQVRRLGFRLSPIDESEPSFDGFSSTGDGDIIISIDSSA